MCYLHPFRVKNKKKNNLFAKAPAMVLLWILVGLGFRCTNEETPPRASGKKVLLVVTTDFASGALSGIDLENNQPVNDLLTLDQDSVVREIDGIPYILERTNANIKRLDKNNDFGVVYEKSLRKTPGEYVNPHDIAKVNDETALVSMYALKEMRVVSLDDGTLTGRALDISSYSSDSTAPDVSQLLRVGGFIYAGIQDIVTETCPENTAGCFMGSLFAAQNSRLLKINVSNLHVLRGHLLPFKNLIGRLQLYTSGNVQKILGAGVGMFGQIDGGVVSYHISSDSFDSPTFQEETASSSTGSKGRDINQVVYVNDTRAFAMLSDSGFKNFVVAFNPVTRTITKQILPLDKEDGNYAEILIEGDSLLVADRNTIRPGIRIFDVNTLEEKTPEPINVGLPPYSMVVVER